MLLQHRSQPLVASPYGVSAFASGNRVETGSYLRGNLIEHVNYLLSNFDIFITAVKF